MLSEEDAEFIKDQVEQDGLDVAMRLDESMEEIDDPKFQKLRKDYIRAIESLAYYCSINLDT